MLTITGISTNECFLTGAKEDVVDVKFLDKSFAGSISWNELLKLLKRKNGKAEPRKEKGTA